MRMVDFRRIPTARKPRDPAPVSRVFVRLDVYHLSVPEGTISRNDEFWKRINETSVNIATHDLLYKNGVRVGEAPVSEWSTIADAMRANPTSVKPFSILATDSRAVELEMNSQPVSQTIFYFDRHNNLSGRSFDRCENLMTLSVQPVPRKPDTVRIAVCPLVRTARKRLEYTTRNDEQEIQYVRPERFYDVNLKSDVPVGSFLIVAPSPESMWETSIGRIFFMKDGAAERLEQVLVMVPRLVTQEAPSGASAAGNSPSR